MPPVTYLDSVLELTNLDSARFSWAGGDYRARPALGEDMAGRLLELELEHEHEAYGHALYEAVFPERSDLREGLREATLAAKREKSRLRFRLHLGPGLPEWVHALYWELLTDPDRHLTLSRSPDTAFSRYLEVRQEQGAPAGQRPRLLCVVAAPSDLARFGMAEISREKVVRRLEASFAALSDAVDVVILEPPATLERLRAKLTEKGGFELLHFFGHGEKGRDGSALVLEDEEGRAEFVEETLLAELFLGLHELRLVTLVACHGGAPSSTDPFSGLAGRLVQRGLPAVIAMRRAVRVDSAHLFTEHLYRHIAQTGRADAAVNEARHQLYLAQPKGIDWSSPVLYSRLSDGRLWVSPNEEAGEASTPLFRLSLHRLRRPLPWVPALLALVLFILGFWPVADAEVRIDLQVDRLFFRLAKSASVIERLELEELAATRLAGLRLPSSLAASAPSSSGTKGFLLAARGDGSHVTLHPPPLPAGTRVGLDHQEKNFYRITVADSDQALRVTFQGDVRLQPLGAPPVHLHLDHPDSLLLVPQSGTAEIDVAFSRLEPDSFSRDIRIDHLDLFRVIDQQTSATTVLSKESTILAGEVRVLATGGRERLVKGEVLRHAELAGSLTNLSVTEDGIHVGFQGRVARLERVPPGLPPVSLMPSVLDLWLDRPVRLAVQSSAGALAVLVLLLVVLDVRPRSRRAGPLPVNA
jgi:hypothetical protein